MKAHTHCPHDHGPAPTLYAVYNRNCGHVAAIPNRRSVGEAFVSDMAAKGQFQWRVRVASTADVQAVVAGERCEGCSQDGAVTA